MKKLLPLLFLALVFLGGCFGSQATVNPYPNDPHECANNLTYDGSFLSGRTFKSHAFVKGVTQADAMKRVARYILSDGWQINNTDSKLGIISASQTVSYGQGKTAPLNVGVEQIKGGVNVTMSFSVYSGATAPVEGVRDFFCSVIGAVQGK